MTPRRKPTNSPPTLLHVAKLAGVGLGTASRALSGEGYVKDATSARIFTAVEQLGYSRNELARSLKVKRSGAVGLVIPDIGGPFMAACVRAIQKHLRQNGYTMIVAFTDGNGKVESDELDYLVRHQVDGVIVIPADGSAPHFHSKKLDHTPVVTFDQPITGNAFDAILVENREGARKAVEHLIGHGHTRIACLGIHRHLYSIHERVEGYQQALKDAGLLPMLEFADTSSGGVGLQIDRWMKLKKPPTALFSLNELTSTEIIEALAVRKIRMPDQLAFIGFDDIELGPYLDPPLTAVLQPAQLIGENTAKRMLERIKSESKLPAKQLLLSAELVIRGSCGCAGQVGIAPHRHS